MPDDARPITLEPDARTGRAAAIDGSLVRRLASAGAALRCVSSKGDISSGHSDRAGDEARSSDFIEHSIFPAGVDCGTLGIAS
jgi:hypothetical protein